MKEMTTKELEEKLLRKEVVNIVDVREVEEVAEGFADGGGQRQKVPQHDSQHETAEAQQDVGLDETLQGVECNVQHEEPPKEPQGDVGKVVVCQEGIQQPPVLSGLEVYAQQVVSQDG